MCSLLAGLAQTAPAPSAAVQQVQPVSSLTPGILASLVSEAQQDAPQAAELELEQTQQQEEAPMDLGDPELAHAAVRIQAAFRGRQARKQLPEASTQAAAAHTGPEPTQLLGLTTADSSAVPTAPTSAPNDELAALSDAQLVQAATHIQAVFRGRQARKALGSHTAQEEQPQQQPELAAPAQQMEAAQEPGLDAALAAALDAELVQAATRIQAIYRGRQARMHMTPRAAHQERRQHAICGSACRLPGSMTSATQTHCCPLSSELKGQP